MRFKLDANLIAMVTGMPHLGLNFFRDLKVSNNVVKLFLHKEERAKIGKAMGGYYNASNIKKIWGCVLNAIMEYITVEGHFTRVHTYHFVLLNHFRHKKRISLPYYLFRSLSRSLNKHSKNPSTPVLHCGLIFLIYEHCKILAIQENKRFSMSSGKGKRRMEEGGLSKEESTQRKKSKNATGLKIQEDKDNQKEMENDSDDIEKDCSEMEIDESRGEERWKEEDVGEEEEGAEDVSNQDSPTHSVSLGTVNSQPMEEQDNKVNKEKEIDIE